MTLPRAADPVHMGAVARLHAESIPFGFLSQLGEPFLRDLYRALSRQRGTRVLIVSDDAGNCVGFIAGTTDTRGLFRRVLTTEWPQLLRTAASGLLSFSSLRKALETALYGLKDPKVEGDHAVLAEMLALAVDHKSRKVGTGRVLVQALECFLRGEGVSAYKVVTHADDPVSNAFYRSCGFHQRRTFRHHESAMNEYVKVLDTAR